MQMVSFVQVEQLRETAAPLETSDQQSLEEEGQRPRREVLEL